MTLQLPFHSLLHNKLEWFSILLFNSLRIAARLKSLFIITIWLIAALIMSACSTAIPPISHPISSHSEQNQPEIIQPPTSPPHSASKASANINVHQKKKQFFNLMKPIVMAENKKIIQQRQTILHLKEKTRLSTREQTQLRHLTSQYQLPMSLHPGQALWQALLARVDIIPLDLALAQAANESAWGTSRFARDGNNYFGQWCFRKGCGMVPSHRSAGASHEVRRFANAAESVHEYMKNINTSPAYRDLRKKRSHLRKRNAIIHAEVLANELKHYSERGMAYVKIIRSMIRSNRKLVAQANAK